MKRALAKIIHNKVIWIGQMICAFVLYLIGFYLLVFSNTRLAGVSLLAGIILLHLAEMKTALRIGQEHGLPVSRIVIMNLLFGYTWWLPVKNGIIIYRQIIEP